MKKIEELTSEECQIFLNEMFEDINAKFERIILDPLNEKTGIEYSVESMDMGKCYIPISNPDLLIWLYKQDVDITEPLNYLKYDYNEMDETNSILFEYAMEIGKEIQKEREHLYLIKGIQELSGGINDEYHYPYYKIEKLQKDLIKKI